MVERPSPLGSQTTPIRGARLIQERLVGPPVFGIPASPGKNTPGGALMNTVLFLPARKSPSSKWVPRPYLSMDGKYGSHRKPRFTVSRGVTRILSSPYKEK